MKKLIALLLVLTMAMGLVACGNNDDTNTTAATTENTTIETDDVIEDTEGEGDIEIELEIEDEEDELDPNSMEALLNNILAIQPASVMGPMVATIDLTTAEAAEYQIQSYTGLENADDISDLAVCESMVGSIAFSLVAVRVKDAANTETVAQAMKDNINPRKWVCVGADQLLVAGHEDVIVLVMLDSALDMTAQSFIDAFKTVCGEDLAFTLN